MSNCKGVQKELTDIKFALDQASIIAITDHKGVITYVNDKFCELSQYDQDELLGKTHRLINSGSHPKSFFQRMWATISRGQVWEGEICNRAKDGSLYWVSTTIVPFLDEKKKPYQYISIRHDISDRKQTEKELTDIKFALDQSSIIAVTDHKGVITYVNDKFCELSQYAQDELLGKTHRLINSGSHPKSFFQRMWATISRGQVWQGEICNRAKDGSLYWVSTTIVPFLDGYGKPYQYISIRHDISQQKIAETQIKLKKQELEVALHQLQRSQTQLVQAEKMSALGDLVAGIAHEINNPVNFIHGNLPHVQDYAQSLINVIALYQQNYPYPADGVQQNVEAIDLQFIQQDLPQMLDSMQLGTDRIRQIVLSLRNFSRIDEAAYKSVEIHDGIDNALLILRHRLKSRSERSEILIVKDYGDLPLVECYAGQLNQVFMNIIINAIEALEYATAQRTYQENQDTPSQITIRTSVIESSWIEVEIADNGLGMPEDVQSRVFDLFFTTKPIGKGTGMGMSISYQIIVEQHGGKLLCFSAPGRGSEFKIQIPVKCPNFARQP